MPPRTAEKRTHLRPESLAERWDGFSLETLRDWRKDGKGPAYIRGDSAGDKATILYPLAAVEDWEKSHLIQPAAS